MENTSGSDAVERLDHEPDGGYLAHTTQGAQVPIARQAARARRRRLGWYAGA